MAKHIKITQRAIADINPAPYNPRDISDAALEGLKASIKKFGFVDPLIVNKKTGVLVGGHQRLRAAIALDFESVPVVELELSVTEEKALNVTLNNQRISGHFTDALQVLLDEIKIELPEEDFSDLKLEELVIDDNWGSDMDAVDTTNETLDGIKSVIKIKCPQEMKKEVLRVVTMAIKKNPSLTGVEIA